MIRKSGASRLLIIIVILLVALPASFFIFRGEPEVDKAIQTLQQLSSEVNLPLYSPKNTEKYTFISASAEDGAIIISSYNTAKGILNVTQQPKPIDDPFGERIEPADSYTTSIGNARLFPDVNQEPYVIVQTESTWVIVRSSSEQIISADLKAFCVNLTRVPQSAE